MLLPIYLEKLLSKMHLWWGCIVMHHLCSALSVCFVAEARDKAKESCPKTFLARDTFALVSRHSIQEEVFLNSFTA